MMSLIVPISKFCINTYCLFHTIFYQIQNMFCFKHGVLKWTHYRFCFAHHCARQPLHYLHRFHAQPDHRQQQIKHVARVAYFMKIPDHTGSSSLLVVPALCRTTFGPNDCQTTGAQVL